MSPTSTPGCSTPLYMVCVCFFSFSSSFFLLPYFWGRGNICMFRVLELKFHAYNTFFLKRGCLAASTPLCMIFDFLLLFLFFLLFFGYVCLSGVWHETHDMPAGSAAAGSFNPAVLDYSTVAGNIIVHT